MTKGQQAMALAMIYPEPTPGKRNDLSGGLTGSAKERHALSERLSLARAVLRAAPDDLAPQVLVGGLSLDKAFEEVEKRQRCKPNQLGFLR